MKIVNLLLSVAVAAGTLAGSAATNEWPFAILRSYVPDRGEVAVEQRQHGSETILRLPSLRACEPVLVHR